MSPLRIGPQEKRSQAPGAVLLQQLKGGGKKPEGSRAAVQLALRLVDLPRPWVYHGFI